MKYLFIFSSLLLFFQSACKPNLDKVRKVDKEYRSSPPGTVWIKDSIFMDQCEIRNLDYLEYVRWVKMNDNANYKKALPDTLVWRDSGNYNEPYVNYYLWHPAYRMYPVVGVSYEQAVVYCKWRTERVKEFAKNISPRSKFGGAYKNLKYYYRLPSKEEWEYAASGGLDIHFPYGFEEQFIMPKFPNVKYERNIDGGYDNRLNDDILVPVNSRKPNRFGLYNAIGNVAEMISEKGISKGGSWIDKLEDCEINDSKEYKKHSAWLGFRCVCVVTK
jgi:formylglycine-generating enzyme required for sulfatase activity